MQGRRKTQNTLPMGDARIVQPGDIVRAALKGRITRIQRMPLGVPAPAAGKDELEEGLNLYDVLTRPPETTLFAEVADSALEDSGIFPGDVLVVDRALRPQYGAAVIVALDGRRLARHYCPDSQALHLLPAHPDVVPISIPTREIGRRCQVWGVVIAVAHQIQLVRAAAQSR